MSNMDEPADVVARDLFERFIWPNMRDHLRVLLRECLSCAPEPAESRSEPVQWLSPEQVANLVGVTPPTVRGWINSKHLAAERVGPAGRLLRVDRTALEVFMRGRRIAEQTQVASVKTRVEEILAKEGQKGGAVSRRKRQRTGGNLLGREGR